MPNIRQYEAQGIDLKPDERGQAALSRIASAKGQEASAIGTQAQAAAETGQQAVQAASARAGMIKSLGESLGSTISEVGGDYVRYQTNKEISRGAPSLVGIQGDLNSTWDAERTNADINDTSVAPKFLEKNVEPALTKFVDGFTTEEGRKWAESQVGSLRQHFYEKTAVDEATRAGQAAKANVVTLKNGLTNNVMSDPSSLNLNLGVLDASLIAVVHSNTNLSPTAANQVYTEQRQETRAELFKAAAIGSIQRNPEAGIIDLKAGKWKEGVDAEEAKTLEAYGRSLQNAAREQERTDAAETRRQNQTAASAAANELVTSLVQKDGSLSFPPDYYKRSLAVATMPDAPSGLGESLLNFGMSKAKELERPAPVYTDPPTYADFDARMSLPESDPRKLTQAEVLQAAADHKLNVPNFEFFIRGVNKTTADKAKAKDFTTFLKSYDAYISKSSFLKTDAYGDQKVYEFHSDAQRLHDQLEAQGVPEAAIRTQIIQSLPKYQVGQQANLDALTAKAQGGLKPLPAVGAVINGRAFLGGDPSKPTSWGPKK